MGLVLDDSERGLHVEARRESFVIFSDYGKESIELEYNMLAELESLLSQIPNRPRQGGLPGTMQALRQLRLAVASLDQRGLANEVRGFADSLEANIGAIAKAARDLAGEPGDILYPESDVYSLHLREDTEAPLWSEAGLYGRVGKEAARTLLAHHASLLAVLGDADANHPER